METVKKITREEKKALALEARKATGSDKIFVNGKGECFTNENAANNSDKKENIDKFDFTEEVAAKKEELTEEEKLAKAKEAVIAKIKKAKTPDAANALLQDFENDADVKEAIAARLKELEAK